MNSILSETFIAIDLGSNSFHMVVAKYEEGHIQIIDRIKDMVRIASGLDKANNLSEEAMQRALQCLERFGQRLREVPRTNVKIVGTNTFRQARNGHQFISRARKALGQHIEIISGQEEARLVFLGVAHTFYSATEKRLVIDIGGGSTECIIGTGFQPEVAESFYMGCVNTSQRFFADGKISARRMREAVLFARMELESMEARYRRIGWEMVLGSSGSIRTISEVALAEGWCNSGISASALHTLKAHLIRAAHHENICLAALSERRKPVFAGGVAILSAIFDALALEQIQVSEGALREGIIYELIGRHQDEDIRNTTATDMARRYSVDNEQADKVISTAQHLFQQAQGPWQLDRGARDLLLWAAELHEIGLAIAHAQYHRHGAYLLSHANMPGFSRQEQEALALLVRAHRRKFPVAEFNALMAEDRDTLTRLAVLLRIAYVLNRSRSYQATPRSRLAVNSKALTLTFPDNWLAEHPLTAADLKAESEYLHALGIGLQVD